MAKDNEGSQLTSTSLTFSFCSLSLVGVRVAARADAPPFLRVLVQCEPTYTTIIFRVASRRQPREKEGETLHHKTS